jgi:hypothetical protein
MQHAAAIRGGTLAAIAAAVQGATDVLQCEDSEDSEDDDAELMMLMSAQAGQLVDLAQQYGVVPREYTQRSAYWVKPRQPSFFFTTVEPFYQRGDWLTHYRLDRATFYEILEQIKPLIERQDTNYREAVTAEQRLSCTLLYLATGTTMQQMASMEGISIPVVHRAVHVFDSGMPSQPSIHTAYEAFTCPCRKHART